MRNFWFGFLVGWLVCLLVIMLGIATAEARYRPLVATQDEDAISCATDAQRLEGFKAAAQLPGLRVIRINAMENMNPIFECDPVGAIRAVAAKGYTPYVTVVGGPRYARTLARQVGHLVKTWGVWNEVNHPGWQVGYMENTRGPSSYRKLVVRMARTLRRHDPGSRVLMGELAPLHDLRFILRTAPKGKRTLRVDGIAVHAYRWYEPPHAKTIGGMRGYIKAFRVASRRLARERRLCRPGLSRTAYRPAYDGRQKRKHTLKRSGCRPVPIYVTEAGYLREDRGTHPIYSSADVAKNLVGSWAEACRGKVAMMFHYQLLDNGDGSWDTSLFSEWGPRPELSALAGYLRTANGCKGVAGALGVEHGPPVIPHIPERPQPPGPTPLPELPNGEPAPPDVPPVVEPEPDPPRVEPTPDPIGLPGPPEPVIEPTPDPVPPEPEPLPPVEVPPVEPVPVDPPQEEPLP